MPALFLLLAALSIGALFHSATITGQNNLAAKGQIDATSGSMLLYRNAVSAYTASNPHAVGTVQDSLLGLPSWYRKAPGLGNYVSAGTSYVFFTGDMPGLISSIHETTESIAIGVNESGVLVSPSGGAPAIPLPPQVPQRAVVIVQ